MNPARATRVQLELGVRLPDQYAEFLSSRGHAVINELTVFGCSEEMSDINALPCVIGATRRLGSLFGLARHELVLAQENGILFVLDCERGLVSEVDWLGSRSVVGDSFGQWLMGVGARD
jgi:hypothetical protein